MPIPGAVGVRVFNSVIRSTTGRATNRQAAAGTTESSTGMLAVSSEGICTSHPILRADDCIAEMLMMVIILESAKPRVP